jgi:signal transduction histidine kinase
MAMTGRIRALGMAREAAETRSIALGTYVAELSHDLMIPMRLLMASVAALERRSRPSRELSTLRRNADKLLRSMDRLLGAPHPDRGAPSPQAGASTDLGAVVRDRVSAFSAAAPEGSAGPQIELEPRLLVAADIAAVERIVDKVLGSIMEGGAWNGDSRIAVRQVRGRIELWAEMTSAECLDGTGFPLTERQVEAADAFIERGVLPGGGSSIRVSLPAAAASEKSFLGLGLRNKSLPSSGPAPSSGIPRESELPANGENRPVVLIVSEDPGLRARLAARLGSDFWVTLAEDAGTALEILASERTYRVVVVDLPGGIADGLEVLRSVRSELRRVDTAFVIAAASEEREGRREVLSEGSVVLLPKPLDLEETASAAADLSRRSAATKYRQENEYQRRLELMLGGLSHSIKNPLSGITGPLACLRRLPSQELGPGAEKYLSQMEESAGRIGTILRDVGAALFAGPLKSEAIDLDVLLGGIAENIRTAHPLLKLTLDPSGGMAIRGDPEAARTIFENVLMNAVEAMEGKGELRVAIVRAAARVEIEVRDRGPGIPPADLARVFDPFFSTKGMGRGLGLGLAIVRDLAGDMAWDVDIRSKAGEGTVFKINAPRFRLWNSAS